MKINQKQLRSLIETILFEIDSRPKCPKCGEPARYVTTIAKVKCILEDDGSIGKVVGVANKKIGDKASYICGGNHEWGNI